MQTSDNPIVPPPAPSEQWPAGDVEALYFLGPQNHDNIEFDFAPLSLDFVSNIDSSGRPKVSLPQRTLLPENFVWQSPSGAQRIPMLLSEFCAYKSALAYGEKKEIFEMLGDATDPCFFDTAGHVTDTQGFAFCYDGMVFVSMRGTELGKDWPVNLSDHFTDQIDDKDKKLIENLARRFAGHDATLQTLIGKLQNRPGMHLGFAMAWEEVTGKVIEYLEKTIVPKYKSVPPIVLTGHSLGGALATVGAYDLQKRGYPVAAVVTFGAPCVGNKSFADSYCDKSGSGLGSKTVRFVADGDPVPKIMRRWYYSWPNSIKHALGGGELKSNTREFDHVGSSLMFTGAPKPSLSNITMAIDLEIERRKKAEENAKKANRQKDGGIAATAVAKTNEPAKAGKGGKNGSIASLVLAPIIIMAGLMCVSPTLSLGDSKVAQSEVMVQSPAIEAARLTNLAQAEQSAPSTDTAVTARGNSATRVDTPDISLWFFLFIFAILFTLILIGSKISSHSVSHRYAIYLSTLSYQKIRSFRASDPEPFEARLAAANSDLDRYMRFIRGDTQGDLPISKFLKVVEMPVRLVKGLDLDVFKAANEKEHIF